ncbi:MAG: hypothetical protein J6W23_05415, partial [Victivallales bacterium]|nr:hypothetical protein [Victivallales bacterium]
LASTVTGADGVPLRWKIMDSWKMQPEAMISVSPGDSLDMAWRIVLKGLSDDKPSWLSSPILLFT